MKTMLKSVAAASLLLGGSQFLLAAKAAAAPATAQLLPGIAVANIEAVVGNSNAFKAAQQQRPVTYKAQYDQASARATQIQAQLKPLAEKFDADRKAPNPNTAALQQQYAQIQQIQQAGQEEINRILAPAALSEAYVQEQISDRLNAAIQAAMAKKGISLVIAPQSVIAASNGYNINQAILDELNAAIPSAQLVPPQGWVPKEVRDQRAAQAAQAGRPGQRPVPSPTGGR